MATLFVEIRLQLHAYSLLIDSTECACIELAIQVRPSGVNTNGARMAPLVDESSARQAMKAASARSLQETGKLADGQVYKDTRTSRIPCWRYPWCLPVLAAIAALCWVVTPDYIVGTRSCLLGSTLLRVAQNRHSYFPLSSYRSDAALHTYCDGLSDMRGGVQTTMRGGVQTTVRRMGNVFAPIPDPETNQWLDDSSRLCQRRQHPVRQH